MKDLRVNELLAGDKVVVEATAYTLPQEATTRIDVWVRGYSRYYRVIYTGAYNYLTVLGALDDPRGNDVVCEVLYSGPENRNCKSEVALAAHNAKQILLDVQGSDLITTQCF